MRDKNGIEIRTGDVVLIKDAYFKSDCGYYVVTRSPGDPCWLGKDHSLKKISARGKVSTAKYSVGFWPIIVCVSDYFKRAEATRWNKENATIEVVWGIDRTGIRAMFEEEAEGLHASTEYYARLWGEDNAEIKRYRAGERLLREVAAR